MIPVVIDLLGIKTVFSNNKSLKVYAIMHY